MQAATTTFERATEVERSIALHHGHQGTTIGQLSNAQFFLSRLAQDAVLLLESPRAQSTPEIRGVGQLLGEIAERSIYVEWQRATLGSLQLVF